MLTAYIQAAMRRATYKLLPEDKLYFGNIPGFEGVWASAVQLEDCRQELQEVLEDWLLIRLSKNLEIPSIDGIEIKAEAAV